MTEETTEADYSATYADKLQFWKSFVLAVQAEPRSATEIRGASGLMHPALMVGVDDIRRRIVVISRDPEPRSAALSQFDIQSANPNYRVIIARPIAINFTRIAAAVAAAAGTDTLGPLEIATLSKAATDQAAVMEGIGAAIVDAFRGLASAEVDLISAWQGAIRQLADITAVENAPSLENNFPAMTYQIGGLAGLDPARRDRELGNCAVPLYDFELADAETLHRGVDVEAVRDVLRRKQLLQYFYPAPDHLVLGFAEGGATHADLARALAQAPLSGHPLGELELIAPTRLEDVIDTLYERHLIVEGELGYDLSPEGRSARALVRFKPREGFLAKLSRLLSFKINLSIKDLFQ